MAKLTSPQGYSHCAGVVNVTVCWSIVAKQLRETTGPAPEMPSQRFVIRRADAQSKLDP